MQKLLPIVAFIAILGNAGCASTQAPPTVDISGKWAGTWVSTNQPAGGSGQIEMTVKQTGSRTTAISS